MLDPIQLEQFKDSPHIAQVGPRSPQERPVATWWGANMMNKLSAFFDNDGPEKLFAAGMMVLALTGAINMAHMVQEQNSAVNQQQQTEQVIAGTIDYRFPPPEREPIPSYVSHAEQYEMARAAMNEQYGDQGVQVLEAYELVYTASYMGEICRLSEGVKVFACQTQEALNQPEWVAETTAAVQLLQQAPAEIKLEAARQYVNEHAYELMQVRMNHANKEEVKQVVEEGRQVLAEQLGGEQFVTADQVRLTGFNLEGLQARLQNKDVSQQLEAKGPSLRM